MWWAARTIGFWMIQAVFMASFILFREETPAQAAFRVIFVTTIMAFVYVFMEKKSRKDT